jgi:hypothetical protein
MRQFTATATRPFTSHELELEDLGSGAVLTEPNRTMPRQQRGLVGIGKRSQQAKGQLAVATADGWNAPQATILYPIMLTRRIS